LRTSSHVKLFWMRNNATFQSKTHVNIIHDCIVLLFRGLVWMVQRVQYCLQHIY
jgi:hypothetical protein